LTHHCSIKRLSGTQGSHSILLNPINAGNSAGVMGSHK
jgi:hypothetical protein